MKQLLIVLCILGVALLFAGCGNEPSTVVPQEETAGATTTVSEKGEVLTSPTVATTAATTTTTKSPFDNDGCYGEVVKP